MVRGVEGVAKAWRRGGEVVLKGAGCRSAALTSLSAGNGGTGDPLARWSVGSSAWQFHIDVQIHD